MKFVTYYLKNVWNNYLLINSILFLVEIILQPHCYRGSGLLFRNLFTTLLQSPFWWCNDALLRGMKVTAQQSRSNRKPPKIFLSNFIEFYLFCLSYFQVSFPMVTFSTHPISNSHLHSTSYSLNLPLSFFISLSPAYSPLGFYLSLF